MGHRWLSTDNGSQCFRCGLVLDYRTESELGGNFTEEFAGASDLAHSLAPGCSGPETERAHHLTIGAHPVGDGYFLECAYGDASGDEIRLGPAPFEPECIGPDRDVYGPDGVPLDGPRTTAAVWADQLAPMRVYLTGARIHPLDIALVVMYRNAAADEGSRYVEAIAGACAMRRWAFRNVPRPADLRRVPGGDAWDIERAHGIPTR